MSVRIYISLFLVLSGNQAWSQAHTYGEAVPSNGTFHVGSAFTGSNPGGGTVGIGGGVTAQFHRWIGGAAELDFFPGTMGDGYTTMVEYLVGPRISVPLSPSARITPFGHALFGGQTFNNSSTQHTYYYANGTGGVLAGDGGVDVRITRHLELRGQAGVIHSTFATHPGSTSITSWRAGTFFVYRF
jgi:hypothetical protein